MTIPIARCRSTRLAVPLEPASRVERHRAIGIVIGRLYDHYYVTTGNMANIKMMAKLGAEMAQDLKRQGVLAVILTAT